MIDFIQSNDKVAQSILRSVYAMLKDHEREEEILKLIEGAYTKPDSRAAVIIDSLLREAREILQGAVEWEVDHQELYKALEQIVVLGAREKIFKAHFEKIEDTIAQALQLDFRGKAPLTEIAGSQQNILNYTSVALNTVLERLNGAVASQKAVDALIGFLQPGAAVVITDDAYSILFASAAAKDIFRDFEGSVTGTSLGDLLNEPGQMSERVKAGTPFEVQLKGTDRKLRVDILPVLRSKNEIDEHVFLISAEHVEQPAPGLDLSGESSAYITLINQIIGAANYISGHYSGQDEHIQGFAELIYQNAWQLKERAQGSLSTRMDSLPAGYDPIDFSKLTAQVAQYLQGRAELQVENNLQGVFFSDPIVLEGVVRDLVGFGLKQAGEKTIIRILIENWDTKGVILAIDWDSYQNRTSEQNKDETGLQLVRPFIRHLNGTLSYHSKENYLVLKLPYAN